MPVVQLPDGTSAEFPDDMTPEAITGVIQGHLAQSEKPGYRGAILPFSEDAQGKTHLDMSAGLPGTIASALTLPGDVATGKVPTPYSDRNATTDPIEALARSRDFAMMLSPSSAALRAGEVIPGAELTQSLGAPSARTLRDTGSAGYDALRATGAEYDPKAVSDLATSVQNDLTRRGFGSAVAPTTHGILDPIANPQPLSGAGNPARIATIDDIMAIRQNLGNVSGTPQDAAASGIAKRAVDDFLGSVDPKNVVAGGIATQGGNQALSAAELSKMYRDANGNYSAAMRSNALTGELDRANTGLVEKAAARAEATHSGRNLDNAIRQRAASLLEKPKDVTGYSDAELEALRSVVSGGPVRNTSRVFGNLLGGGGGMHALIGALGTGAGASALGHDALTSFLAAGVPPSVGYGLKALENSLARRSVNQADEVVRSNSPLNQQMLDRGLLTAPALTRNSAILRALLPGLISEPPTPRPASPSDLALLLAGGA